MNKIAYKTTGEEIAEFGSNNYDQAKPQSVLDIAKRYKSRGWVPIPIASKDKKPLRNQWQLSTLETPLNDFENGQNIGILLGDASGGLVDVDLDCDEAIELAPYFLPKTDLIFGPQSNPTSHWLYRVNDCGGHQQFRHDGETIAEYRANRHITTFPPSTYADGRLRAFSIDGEPGESTQSELTRALAKIASAVLLIRDWKKGTRHDKTLALSGSLFRAGWSLDEVEQYISAICRVAGDDEINSRINDIRTTQKRLDQGGMVTGLPSLAKHLSSAVADNISGWLNLGSPTPGIGHNGGPADTNRNIQFTESGNADRFIARHGNDLRFCAELDSWFVWNVGRWERDQSMTVQRLAEETARSIFAEESSTTDSREREAIVGWATKSCSKRVIDATLGLAKPRLTLEVDAFDRDPWLLNFTNGTVDLRTGRFRDHDREDGITKQIPYGYDETASCPGFERFLDEITEGNQELIGFFQRALGYSLTGRMDEQCMFIAFGEGANGKSTLLNLFNRLLGDYAMNAPVQTFIAKKSESGASDDLARLRGARYVTAAEAAPDQPLDEALIKRVTAGDPVTARHLYGRYFDFLPQFKIWLSTNNRLKITGTDQGIWRRIREVPFPVTFPESKRDTALPEKLESEANGILAWAVRGCVEWHQGGLNPPDIVQRATESYRTEMDVVGQFLNDATIKKKGARLAKGDAYTAYQKWAAASGNDELPKNQFGRRMKAAKVAEKRSGSKGHYWLDIQLVPDDEISLIAEHRETSPPPSDEENW